MGKLFHFMASVFILLLAFASVKAMATSVPNAQQYVGVVEEVKDLSGGLYQHETTMGVCYTSSSSLMQMVSPGTNVNLYKWGESGNWWRIDACTNGWVGCIQYVTLDYCQ